MFEPANLRKLGPGLALSLDQRCCGSPAARFPERTGETSAGQPAGTDRAPGRRLTCFPPGRTAVCQARNACHLKCALLSLDE